MVQPDLLSLRQVAVGVLVIFAVIGTLFAAEVGQQSGSGPKETAKSAAPADSQSSGLLSRLRFYGEFGPIYLHRQDNRSPAIINNGVSLPSPDLGWNAGPEARGGVTLGDFSAEFRWFNAGHVFGKWSESAHFNAAQTAAIVSPTTGLLIATRLDTYHVGHNLSSDFTNMEGNLRWQIHPYVAVLAGVRRLSLDDDLGMRMTVVRFQESTSGTITLSTNQVGIGSASRNKLWGGQLGVDSRVPVLTQDLLLGGAVKVAYLHNSAKSKLGLVQQAGAAFGGSDHDGLNSWGFELGMDLRYNIFPWVTVVGGYQALWIQKIVQGTDPVKLSIGTTNNVFSPLPATGSVNTSSLWFHGPRAAIVIRLPD